VIEMIQEMFGTPPSLLHDETDVATATSSGCSMSHSSPFKSPGLLGLGLLAALIGWRRQHGSQNMRARKQ
jgi:MYXO-CTERM domain-containing protein